LPSRRILSRSRSRSRNRNRSRGRRQLEYKKYAARGMLQHSITN
jgi:hypothetical protein